MLKNTINTCFFLMITTCMMYAMDKSNQPNVYIATSSGNVIRVDGAIAVLFPTLINALHDEIGTENDPMPLPQFNEAVIRSVIKIAQAYNDNPQLVIDAANQFSNDNLDSIIEFLGYLGNTNIAAILQNIVDDRIVTLKSIAHDQASNKAHQYLVARKRAPQNIASEVKVFVNNKEFIVSPQIASYMKTVQDAVGSVDEGKLIELSIANGNVEEVFAFIIDLIKQYNKSPQGDQTIQDMMMKKPIPYLVQLLNMIDYLNVEKIMPIIISTISFLIATKIDLITEEYRALGSINPWLMDAIADQLFERLEPFIAKQGFMQLAQEPYLTLDSKRNQVLGFSNDGKRLFLLRDISNCICIDLETKNTVNTIMKTFDFDICSVNNDGSIIVFLPNSGENLYIWNVNNNSIKDIKLNIPDESSIFGLNISPDGRKIAIILSDDDFEGQSLIIAQGNEFSDIITVIDYDQDFFISMPIAWSFDSKYVMAMLNKKNKEYAFIHNRMTKVNMIEPSQTENGVVCALNNDQFIIIDEFGDTYLVNIDQNNDMSIKFGYSSEVSEPINISVSSDFAMVTASEDVYVISLKNGLCFATFPFQFQSSFIPDVKGIWEIRNTGVYRNMFTVGLQKECFKQLKLLSFEKIKFISDKIQYIIKKQRKFDGFTSGERYFLLQKISLGNLRILENALKELYQKIMNTEHPFAPVLTYDASLVNPARLEDSDTSDEDSVGDEANIPVDYLGNFRVNDSMDISTSDEDSSGDEANIPAGYLNNFRVNNNDDAIVDTIPMEVDTEPIYPELEKAFPGS